MFLASQLREQQNPSQGDTSLRNHREQRETFERDGRDIPMLDGTTVHCGAHPLPGLSIPSEYSL